MKKKVFSLMMTLLLAFLGVAKAELVEVGVGGTTTNSYLPCYTFYNNNLTQQIYTAEEIGTGGTITSIAFFNGGSTKTPNLTLFLVNTDKTAFNSATDWITVTAADQVFSGDVTLTSGQWTTITLTTPFEYDGTSNMGLVVDEYMSWNSGLACRVFNGTTNCSMRVYSDGTNYNPFTPTNYTGTRMSVKNQLQLDITANSGDRLHLKYMADDQEVIDTLNLGVRPINAWTEPFAFQMYTDGPDYTVTVLDFTPSDGMFTVSGEELPFQVVRDQGADLTIGINATQAGLIERQFVAITEGDRAAHIWPIAVEMYDPAIPDVVEKAYNLGNLTPGFSYVGIPSQITPTELHDDYNLPFTDEPYNIPDGVDAVYKFTVTNDMIINAYVDTLAENGKVALYTEDFNGEGGPMAHNYYQGLPLGGEVGGDAAPFEAQIGDGTTTTSYCPFYTYYNYSVATALYTAGELQEAGVTTAPMNSISFYATQGAEEQNGITLWMANVTDTEVPTSSPATAGMTKVYTGSMAVETGWNEFVFNESGFAWDGTSNVMILCQRNNGNYAYPYAYWQAHNPGFYGMGYIYNDYNAYDVENTSTTMNRSNTTRPDIMLTSTGRNRETVTIGTGTG